MLTLSVQGPLTVTVCGPVTSSELMAVLTLANAPGVPPVQSTVAFAARALAGWRHTRTAAQKAARRSERGARRASLLFIRSLLSSRSRLGAEAAVGRAADVGGSGADGVGAERAVEVARD